MEASYISGLKNDSIACFEEIYFKYNRFLFNYFNKRIGSEVICEDLIQETFIRLWKFRSGLDNMIAFEIQLFRIAKTALIDVARRNAKRLEIYMPHDVLPEPAVEDSYHLNIDAEKREQLHYLLTKLPPVRRQILNLKIEGYSNKEIAQQLTITVKTVENNINLAYKELRKSSSGLPLILLLLFLIK